MSEHHRKPHVTTADESRRVPYLKPKSRIGISWSRLLYNVHYISRHWKDRLIVKAAAVVLVYTIGLYAFIKKCYGNEHPLNRYQWRQMKKNGQLSQEMLHKEEVVQNYMKTRFDRMFEKEPTYVVRKQGPPGVL
ncbi:unnamed protein product [Cercopithifilaria johnstoni]|uniref:Uncharacterized protein n=1 Tax=Cercopithifilaria johnstoni TaxID=2874296 RepID=A0A8J2LZG6_9BILA|nr:unnamed protein product [Cercopithifilaria johnstoni]